MKIFLKKQAITLRLKGKSYNYITRTLNLPSKGTLNYWFKNINLPIKTVKLLEKNNTIAWKKGLANFNKLRSEKIKRDNKEMYRQGVQLMKNMSKNDLLLIGTALYWGEGTKLAKHPNTAGLAFTNSDPRMIQVYMRFLREVLDINNNKIRAGIHLYSTIERSKARRYWSKVAGLPEERFYIVEQISRASLRKKAYNTLPYGTVVIKVNSRLEFFKIKGMIDGLIQKLLK